jgi:lipopolysaccharide export system protein LptC
MTAGSRARNWLLLLPLLIMLSFVYWLNQQAQHDTAVKLNSQRHDPDGIMINFHATTMDLQGIPHILLNAEKLMHYPDHDTTELEMPHMTMLTQNQPAVHVDARHGTISSQGDEVIFQEHVSVLREASAEQSALTLQTEYLRMLPNQDRANTDKAVTIENTSYTIRSIGLELDNKARILKLLSQVRSEYHAK